MNPNGTYDETVGVNSNTWTNYTNAGGSQGPTIPAFNTVQIACWVTGFRVADGNTYWYLIASSPWNYQYYVSADPFYNNGATSGSLHGTPWVDPAVPSCNAGVSGVPETAGGAANTWTNYTNAGGTQGPTIGGLSTVIMACKINGFRVADGNTWWYRVASHPWNNSYYVSADAFYNNGQTSGSLKGTPFVDPNVPDCQTGGGGGGSAGLTETVGGNTTTWTNYTNAGGTQGPTIPNGASVSITCKLTGFRVADGNTWWYQIGSSPWNNNYYASADAFYNNGQTSGSLLGTPFVDAAVPDCTPPGGTRPGTETTGGAAQTWANYSHAGGQQGPTIPAFASVSVTCRAQGFRVADGNTWWYQVASSPWNNVFYVSADPFYNNGQTSGSLHNTPFYDPAIPVCVGNREAPLYFTSVATGHASSHSTGCTYGHYPVNCASGDFWHTFSDVSIAGRGTGLHLDRTYNALDPSSAGPFGYGWSSTWDQQLLFNDPTRSDGSILVTRDDGSQIPATPNGSGGFTTPPSSDTTFSQQPDGSYLLTVHHLTLEKYSTTGQLLAISDLNGNTTSFSYSSGQLTTVTDAAGRNLTITHDANGRIDSVTDPMGRASTYTYDAANNLSAVTGPLARVWTFSYDGNHRMTTMTNPRGDNVTNTYLPDGRIATQTDPAGLTTRFAYSGDNFGSVGGTTTITDPHGVVRVEQYVNGFMTQVTHALNTPAQDTWAHAYDPSTFGKQTTTDPNGTITSQTFDTAGHVLSTTDGNGNTTLLTYNSLGQQTSSTTPLGHVTTDAYDANGNLTTHQDADGNTTVYTHDDAAHPSDVTSITDPDGRVTTLTYDSAGNVASKTGQPAGGVSTTQIMNYDQDGELTCQVSAVAVAASTTCPTPGAGHPPGTTLSTHDAAGQVTSVQDANGHTSTYTYDGNGNRTSVSDPNGNLTRTNYDADNRVSSVTQGAGTAAAATTSDGYDVPPGSGACPAGMGTAYCTTSTDPNGATTLHVYDARDHEITTVRPGSQTTSYTYDGDGNERTQTDSRGITTTYSYDANNRKTGTTYSDSSTPSVAITYDADGNRKTMHDGTGTTTYTYDNAARLTSTVDGAANTVAYTYDGAGHITQLSYPNGHTVARTYNGAGWLATVTDWLGNTTSFSYDADGNPTTTAYPNGDSVSNSYDSADNLTTTSLKKGATALAALTYQRTPADQVSQEIDTGTLKAATLNMSYSARNELTAYGTTQLGYDPAGRLTNKGPSVQTYDNADELTTTSAPGGNRTFTYDAMGNRVNATSASFGRTTQYTYDAENRLTDQTSAPATPTVAGVSPTTGSQGGGSTVTISGQGLSEATGVLFGSRPATSLTIVSDTTLLATTPPNNPSTIDVTVLAPGGPSVTNSNDSFTFTNQPVVTTLSVSAGPTSGGTTTVLTGAGFTTATSVLFGTKPSSSFTVDSDSQITATAPKGAGKVNVTVTTATGTTATGVTTSYLYSNTPKITRATPAVGPQTGGAVVTISGTAFTGATKVTFGTANATKYTVASDNAITATAPAGKGTVDITVTSPKGTTPQVATDKFTYKPAPTVTSVQPLTVAESGGDTITVTGKNFTPTSRASLGGNAAPTRYISATTLKVIAPAGTGSQDMQIVTDGGTSTLSAVDKYTYVSATKDYRYNGDGLRATATSRNSQIAYVWQTTTDIAQVLDDGTNSYIYGSDGSVIEHISQSGAAVYYFHDATGSTRALTDSSGGVVSSYTYGPYGGLQSVTGPVQTPVLFAGGYLDLATSRYYLVHRYYDPSTGQFFSVDPAIDTTHAPYGYSGDDPVNSTDPSGLSWSPLSWTRPVWNTIDYAFSFVRNPYVNLVYGGVQALGGWASAAGTCLSGGLWNGWGTTVCSDATWNATLQSWKWVGSLATAGLSSQLGHIYDSLQYGYSTIRDMSTGQSPSHPSGSSGSTTRATSSNC